MRKITFFLLALLAAVTLSATVVNFDFSNPTSMGLTPSSKTSDGVLLNSDTIIVGDVAMSFSVPSGNGAKLWTAKGPTYTLRLYMPTQMILTSSGDNIRGIRVTRSQGDLTELDENNEWRGDAKSVTLSVPDKGKANYITTVTVYVGEEMPAAKVDTISVREARQRIDDKNMVACYIKAVVAGTPFTASSKNCVWLTDINTPGDSIQGFGIRKGKASTETYKSLDEMAADFGLQDTILVYADALGKYNSIYEIAGGYFVETIGKSAAIDAGKTFPYAFGAVQMEQVEGKYRYEIVLSKTEDDYNNALHYVIRSSSEKGIAGTYSAHLDSSYVDGAGRVSGSLTITYVSEGTPANTYSLTGDISVGSTVYRFDEAQYDLAGYSDPESDEPFKLVDDVPFVPQEGDTITCAQAVSYAQSLGEVTGVTVYVRGFATGFAKVSSRTQQSVYMADDSEATKGVFQAHLCYTQNLDSIIKGDEILAYGAVTYYAKTSQAQISKGKICRIGGSDTKRPRNPQYEDCPAGAITIAQAMQIGDALQAEVGQTVETSEEYTVVGYIVDVNRQMVNDTANWYMADDSTTYGEFQAYKCQIKSLICAGDGVYVTGKIAKYQVSADVAKIEIIMGKAGFVGNVPPASFMLSVSSSNSSLGYVIGGGEFASGEVASIAAVCTKENYRFSHWSDGSQVAGRNLTMTKPLSLTAYFDLSSKDTVVIHDTTVVNLIEVNSLNPTMGEAVLQVHAVPNNGYQFVCWSDYDVTNPRIVATSADPQTFTAVFSASPTSVRQLTEDANTTGKMVKDGQLLIRRQGKTYNAVGAELR